MLYVAAAVLLGYLTGGIPFGLLVVRWLTGKDIRQFGSGNIGATNVGRMLGFRFGLFIFALDMLKGAIPVLLVLLWQRSQPIGQGGPFWLADITALAAIVGHVFPIYLRLQGGKGVASTAGAVLPLAPVPLLLATAGWIGLTLLTRYISIASVLAAFLLAGLWMADCGTPFAHEHYGRTLLLLAIAVLVFARHIPNFKRLWAGTEAKVRMPWQPKPTPPADRTDG